MAICTVSLGVLKASHKTLFHPTLPDQKVNSANRKGFAKAKVTLQVEAIEKLGFGVMDKIFLVFDRVFWDQVWCAAFIKHEWTMDVGALLMLRRKLAKKNTQDLDDHMNKLQENPGIQLINPNSHLTNNNEKAGQTLFPILFRPPMSDLQEEDWWTASIAGFDLAVGHQDTLCGWIVGRAALHMETLTEEQVEDWGGLEK